ncbi:MAG: hypothetical protein GY953_14670, partial [bacterium]|nr:hypothetical protein [bacterium]
MSRVSGSIRALFNLGLLLALAFPLAAQTGSITLHSVDIEFGESNYTFVPGGDNVFEIPTVLPFLRRRGDFTARVSFNARAGAKRESVVAACIITNNLDRSGGYASHVDSPWIMDPAGPLTEINFPNVLMRKNRFQIGGEATAAPEVTYTLKCELQKLVNGAVFEPFAESEEIVFRHTFGADFTIDHIEVVQVVQDAGNTVPLVAGKPANAHIFAKRSTPGSSNPVPMRLFYNREGLPEFSQTNDGVFPSVVDMPDRGKIRHSHNITIPKHRSPKGYCLKSALIPSHSPAPGSGRSLFNGRCS